MIVHAKISALKESRWYEYGARFAFGGFTTLIAGVIGDRYGPETGGLFLAFPAIFCACATLIETHERKRKKEHGLDGYRRGTDAAALDASGAALGGIGLAGFGLMVWLLAPDHSLMSLVIASITWVVVSTPRIEKPPGAPAESPDSTPTAPCWRLHQTFRHSRK